MPVGALRDKPQLDRAVAHLVGELETLLPHAGLGFYLHGSAASGHARPDSDIDILALATEPISQEDRDAALALADDLAQTLQVPFDFHLHPVEALIDDPYVDLRRTSIFLAGVDVRPRLPVPTLDALAREAVLGTCLLATELRGVDRVTWPLGHPDPDDRWYGRLPEGSPRSLAKALTWMSSARVAARIGYAPTSAVDALCAVRTSNDPAATWVTETVQRCRQVDLASATAQEREAVRQMCQEALAYENDTLAALHAAVTPTGVLGAACRAVLETYIVFP